MAKSNRHKKLRKQEKSKVQLTGVKKLSKAKNVVEPTLRVKKILIREQLKTGSLVSGAQEASSSSGAHGATSSRSSVVDDNWEETYTRRRQSVQDLLSSANHHNVNMRKDALVGLQEIAISHFNTILRNLDRILTKIAGLASDQENVVRKENLKLAETILSKISENQLRPFWTMLMAHLKCALTHLLPSIRYGALALIEVLVDHHSTLISESSSIMLPSILSLISTTHKDSTSNLQKPGGNVTKLKVELSGKHSDTVERLKVLRMLSKCTHISVAKSNNLSATAHVQINQGYNVSVKPSSYLALEYSFGFCQDQDQENKIMKKFSLQSLSGSAYSSRFYSTITADPFNSPFSSDSTNEGTNFWIEFINSCTPILIETWVELGPATSSNSSSSSYANSDKKLKTKGKQKQADPFHAGNDKNTESSAGRRNGLHILNGANVDNLMCISTLFEQLLQMSGINTATSRATTSSEEQSVKNLRKTHGQNMSKYFFQLMPYISLEDSRRKDVITVNLKLFKIAGELKMFNKEMKTKLQIFIEGAMELRTLDRDHCQQILSILKFLESTQMKSVCTRFLLFASSKGHFEIVAKFLSNLTNPTIHQTQHDKSIQDLLSNVQWNDIICELLRTWKVTEISGAGTTLFQLLTFAALRRLVDMKAILHNHISTFKELMSDPCSGTNVPMSALWESLYRAFNYSDAVALFKDEFASVYPSDFVLT